MKPGEPWDSANVDTWRRSLLAQVQENTSRITTSMIGTWDQVADNVVAGIGAGSPLLAASNYQDGEYYVCVTTGLVNDSNGQKPEIAGQSVGTGDRIIAFAGQWSIFAVSSDYLSSVVDDTAAGVITFSQPPIGTLAATANNHLMRKGESDSGDAVVQGNLDAHIGTAAIHFADAPADDEMYGRRNNGWEVIRLETALLYGAPSSFTLGTGITTLTGWVNGVTNSADFTASAAAGTITINTVGIYSFSAGLIGIQGNDTKEEDIYLWSRSSVSGDEEIWSYHVATDKGANYRPLAREFIVNVTTVPDVFSLGMQATAGLGTFTFINAQFGVSKIEI